MSQLAEVFGYPCNTNNTESQVARASQQCPFIGRTCAKSSRLLSYRFGVCSVMHRNTICITCPYRFEERGVSGNARVLEDIAHHYFGGLENVIAFPEVKLPNVGSIDYVLVRHKPLLPEVEAFVAIEIQSDSTTQTGAAVQALRDFMDGEYNNTKNYKFGMNTYDTIKRSMTQLFNKGIVYEAWGTHCYWIIQEYIYANLVQRYGFKTEGYNTDEASRFALYELKPQEGRLHLTPTRYISTSVEEVYQAMQHNPGLPRKDAFVKMLNAKLQLRIQTHT